MKKILLLLFIILILDISAIVINEVEMNPEDGRYGKEWVELYNDEGESINLSGWKIYDNLKSRYIIPNGTLIEEEDFYIVEFSSAVLNNDGDVVLLYNNNGEEIDRTETLKDSSWSYETWQLCSSSWKFAGATKSEKNNCEESETNKTEKETEVIEEEEIISNISEEFSNNKSMSRTNDGQSQPITAEVIKLTPKNIKSNEDNQILDNSNYAKYGFVIFCVLLGLLFILRRKNRLKNEFKQKRERNKGN